VGTGKVVPTGEEDSKRIGKGGGGASRYHLVAGWWWRYWKSFLFLFLLPSAVEGPDALAADRLLAAIVFRLPLPLPFSRALA